MITPENAHKFVNIAIHMWILFVFLTIFFFTFISKTEEKVINNELSNVIKNELPVFLKTLDKIGGNNIPWKQVNNTAQTIKDKYNGKDPKVRQHNKKILKISISICSIGFVFIAAIILYFTVHLKYNIGLKEILFETIVTTVMIGILEAIFFLNIAIKYSPVKPSQLLSNILNRLKYQLNKQL